MRLTELQNKYRAAKKIACWYKLWADGKERHIQQEWERIGAGLQNVLLVEQGKHRQHLLTVQLVSVQLLTVQLLTVQLLSVQLLSSWMNRYSHCKTDWYNTQPAESFTALWLM